MGNLNIERKYYSYNKKTALFTVENSCFHYGHSIEYSLRLSKLQTIPVSFLFGWNLTFTRHSYLTLSTAKTLPFVGAMRRKKCRTHKSLTNFLVLSIDYTPFDVDCIRWTISLTKTAHSAIRKGSVIFMLRGRQRCRSYKTPKSTCNPLFSDQASG